MNTMRAIKTIILSSVLAASLILGVLYLFPGITNGGKSIKIEHLNSVPANKTVFTLDENGDIMPLDFTKTSEKVLDGVVHIKSTYIQQQAPQDYYQYRGNPDLFRRFFEDDLFDKFFNQPYRPETPENQQNPRVHVGTGSGVIISNDGYIVTNNHVIDNADDVEVTLHDNRVFKAKVIGTDPATDLAVLQIKANNLVNLAFVNSDDVKVGEWVLAVGNPFSLNSTVTAGIVSAKGRNINILKEQYAVENFIQTDAAINPGNSGGALVNLQGGLIGINTAIASPTGAYSGYGFAIPSNIVSKVVEDMIKYGTVQRAILGITIRSLDGNLAREIGLDITKGVYVDSIMDNSAAGKAGLMAGDVIVGIDNDEISSASELQGIIAQHRPGDKVMVSINRKGKEKTINVTLSSKDGNFNIVSRESVKISQLLGADFENLDKQTARKLGISGGVRVKKLYPGKLRRETQMQEGFIITKIDKQPVENMKEFETYLKEKSGGVLVEGIYENLPGRYFYAFGVDN